MDAFYLADACEIQSDSGRPWQRGAGFQVPWLKNTPALTYRSDLEGLYLQTQHALWQRWNEATTFM